MPPKRLTILGIDPGFKTTGYGVVIWDGGTLQRVADGVITGSKENQLQERLKAIYVGIRTIAQEYQPDVAAIEQVFMARNAASALKLGQARGAAIAALCEHQLILAEYSAKRVKQAVTGIGGAEKKQVQQMVKTLLKLDDLPTFDAADALAIAICHAHTQTTLHHIPLATSSRRRRLR